MHIVKVGLDYRNAPLEFREKLTFPNAEVMDAMHIMKKDYAIAENVIVSTCNRTEIFAVVKEVSNGTAAVQEFLGDWFQIEINELNPFLQCLQDNEAIEHLFKLAVGLNSLVIGETQILGQVRSAFLTAQKVKTTGRLFNELFKRVITFAKRAHKETAISEHAVSISYVAVEKSKEFFGNIENKHVAILGAGEMGELALKNLQSSGVKEITVINRTFMKAKEMAQRFNAKAEPIEQLLHVLKEADILISSTGANEVILDEKSLLPLLKERDSNPLFIIDIAVPRDIDRSVERIDQVFLYDIDDLHNVVDENYETRKKTAILIERHLGEEVAAFNGWVAMLDAVPAIKSLRERSLVIQDRTLQSIYNKIPDLTEREIIVLQKHTKSIIHQLLEEPIKTAKRMSQSDESEEHLRLFNEIFGLNIPERKKVSTNT